MSRFIAKGCNVREKLRKAFYSGLIKLKHDNRGFGIAEVLIIAAGVIVVAYIFVPGFRAFCNKIMTRMNTWYDGDIDTKVFPST